MSNDVAAADDSEKPWSLLSEADLAHYLMAMAGQQPDPDGDEAEYLRWVVLVKASFRLSQLG